MHSGVSHFQPSTDLPDTSVIHIKHVWFESPCNNLIWEFNLKFVIKPLVSLIKKNVTYTTMALTHSINETDDNIL